MNLLGFYRPPNNATIEQFCDLFRDRILSQFSPSDLVLTGGDANINLFNTNRVTNLYTDMLYGNSFIPCIALPTRIDNHSQTIIDHIWSNVISNVRSGIFETDITDHFYVFIG